MQKHPYILPRPVLGTKYDIKPVLYSFRYSFSEHYVQAIADSARCDLHIPGPPQVPQMDAKYGAFPLFISWTYMVYSSLTTYVVHLTNINLVLTICNLAVIWPLGI